MRRPLESTVEAVGTASGAVLAPLFASTSFLRRARTFHPRGVVARAEIEPIATLAASALVAQRLAGPALVRFSSALFEHERAFPDALGCAIRFRRTTRVSPRPDVGDQDLLLATIKKPWTMPFAPLRTHVHDYLSNHYFGVSPFEAPPLGRIFLRLRPEKPAGSGPTRDARLEDAVASGRARLVLEARRRLHGRWTPLARVDLVEIVELDQEALRFSPFRDGRGLVPRGFIHALRRAVYPASQAARPS